VAESGGHWATLAQAQKLTQSLKIPGVFEEDIKRVNPIERIPVAQAAGTGLKIEWLRELTTTESAVTEIDIGDALSWGEDVTYTEKESTLRRLYIQRKLDHYLPGIYGTYNNYEALVLVESEKGLKRRIGARLIYADTTYGGSPTQFDGLHALAAEHGTPWPKTGGTTEDKKNIDGNDLGLSLTDLRILIDEMKHGCDELWMPFEIVRRIDAAYQEKGFAGLAYNVAGSLAYLSMGYNELGKRVMFFDGIPIVRTDYLVGEESGGGTGATSDVRALYSSDLTYSIFGLKFGDGNVASSNPGIFFAYGGTQGQGDLYKLVRFPELEDYDAGGIRLVTYGTVILPSTMSLGRIYDVDDVATII
jgi:hypothetical protein